MAVLRILWVTPENRKGGIRSYAEGLVPSVRKCLHGISSPRFDFLDPVYDPANTPQAAHALVQKIKAMGPHVIHLQHEYGLFGSKVPSLYTFPKFIDELRKELPQAILVATAHNVLARDYVFPIKGNGWQFPFRWFANQFMIEKFRKIWSTGTWGPFHAVVVHSKHQAEDVQAAGPKRVEVIPHYVPEHQDNSDFKPAQSEIRLPKPIEAAFQEDRKTVMVFGFFANDKGQDVAVSAIPYMRENIHLLLAGGARRTSDYEYLEKCLDLSRKMGVQERVSVTGFVSDRHMDELYSKANLVIAPFRQTTGSGSLAQGFSRGAPILASDLPLNVELGERVPGCLEYFKACDSQDLAQKVEELLAKPIKISELKERALQYAHEHHPVRMAERHVKLYLSLLSAS